MVLMASWCLTFLHWDKKAGQAFSMCLSGHFFPGKQLEKGYVIKWTKRLIHGIYIDLAQPKCYNMDF